MFLSVLRCSYPVCNVSYGLSFAYSSIWDSVSPPPPVFPFSHSRHSPPTTKWFFCSLFAHAFASVTRDTLPCICWCPLLPFSLHWIGGKALGRDCFLNAHRQSLQCTSLTERPSAGTLYWTCVPWPTAPVLPLILNLNLFSPQLYFIRHRISYPKVSSWFVAYSSYSALIKAPPACLATNEDMIELHGL